MRTLLFLFLIFITLTQLAHADSSATQMSAHAKELLAKNAIRQSFDETLHAVLLDSSDLSIIQQLQTFPYAKLPIDEQLLWHQVADLIDVRQQLTQHVETLNQKFSIICAHAICPSQWAEKTNSETLDDFDDTKSSSIPNQLINSLHQEIENLKRQLAQKSLQLKFISYPENANESDGFTNSQFDPKTSEQAQIVVDLSLRLSESERELTKKILQVKQLTQELEETHSRLELNQHLLQEKDLEIKKSQ